MSKHSHRFVEEYDGLVGYGYSREINEHTLKYYLQKFSDDKFATIVLSRMSDEDMDNLFNLLGDFLKRYLSEKEYHSLFLKGGG
jgi:hypothetical protein